MVCARLCRFDAVLCVLLNNMKRVLVHFVTLCLFACCSSNKVDSGLSEEELNHLNLEKSPLYTTKDEASEIIPLDGAFGDKVREIDNLLDTLYFLPLQTDVDHVFYGIFKMIVSRDRIFIRDYDDRLLIFDRNGMFVNELMLGQGPGEIFQLYDFAFDDKDQNLVVAQPNMLNYYNKDGVFVTSKPCPIISWEFAVLNNGFFFVQPQFVNDYLGDDARYSAIITSDDIRVAGRGIPIGHTEGLVRHLNYTFAEGGSHILSIPGNDTIYEVSDSDIKAKYILDFHENETRCIGNGEFDKPDNFYHSSGFLENSQTQFFYFNSPKNGSYSIIRDRKSKKMLGASYFMSSPDVVPMCCANIKTVYDDYFVSYIDPYSGMHYSTPAVSDKDNDKVKNLTDEDNAVLVFFKLKTLE